MAVPKLQLWAKLIQSGQHTSYDVPQQIPLITGSPTPIRPRKDGSVVVLTGAAMTIAHALNPHCLTSFCKDVKVSMWQSLH